ncbi:MAG: hypothetical protein IJF18_03065 [Oscillospiraceae bacterium]|nr:hypothetical protein [Oscillospiraceae bacterium]
MEKRKLYEIFTVKNVLLYVLKVLVLFFIMYFSFTTSFVLIFILGFTIPIYAAAVFGLAYLLSKFPKSENTEDKNFFKRHILKPLLLLVGVGVMFLGLIGLNLAFDKLKEVELKYYLKNADQIIEYNTATYHVGGIMGTDYEHDLIIIDYDTMTVGFLYHPYVSAELVKYKLKNNTAIQSENIQCEYELDAPGAKFRSFFPDESSKHRTTAIEIEMSDGSFYSLEGMVDKDSGYTMFLGLW